MQSKRLSRIPPKYRKTIETELRILSRCIQDKREQRGLTQEQLAEQLEVSSEAIRSIEQGRRYPSLPMLFYILKFLKINFEMWPEEA